MVKKIESREVNGIQYDLVFFEGDHIYVIYKWDREDVIGRGAQIIPEIARFNKEKDARDYLNNL